ncbi:hypothetical protein Fot_41125 [Forsythia ovata]|uniref:Uncharacterized protein n=1 Tax=Forsythia ovata TaxID=205694 RepID=A0ABD1RHC5_9LAMI
MVSLWSYQENIDELNQQLMYAILELEKSKVEASEETKKNTLYVKQLIQLLNITIQERDEARNQLQKLLEKFMLTSSTEGLNILPQFHVDNPLVKPGKANSSITESNSLSDTYNYHSHVSSPVDSIFDAASSPELSNINMLSTNQTILSREEFCHQTGKFLQAVVEAGPLLQTLLVAGTLPRWRNPPRLQPFQIPPAPIKGSDHEIFAQKTASNLGQLVSNSQSCAPMSCGSSQILSAPMSSFANVPPGSFLHNGVMMSSRTDANSCIPLAKRRSLY